MPRRNKKKSTAKPKRNAGISINIKNVMKQVQNERQPTDFIRPGKDPKRNFNNGSMTTMFAPPVTYASTPLSAFPSLASVNAIKAPPDRAPAQLASNSEKPMNDQPVINVNAITDDNLLTPKPPIKRAVLPTPPVGPYNPRYRFTPLIKERFTGVKIPGADLRAPQLSLAEAIAQPAIPQQNDSDELVGIAAAPDDQVFSPPRAVGPERMRPGDEPGRVKRQYTKRQIGPRKPRASKLAKNLAEAEGKED